MGSVGNQNPLAPYENYKDCSLGICSIYCTQFCYLFFPPPPPSEDDSSTPFSPLIIAVIGVLASAFLLVSYYTIVTRYCKRRNDHTHTTNAEALENRDETPHDQWQVAATGLDEAVIKTITVCKYRKGEGLIEGSDCAVCLSEFQENESLRLLPKCNHAFHLPCIDTWLKSHSNCPLCRASVVALASPLPPPLSSDQVSAGANVSSYVVHRPNDLVLVVDDQERNCDEHVVLSLVDDHHHHHDHDHDENLEIRDENNVLTEEEGVKEFRRSISLGTFSSQRQLLISDILKIEEIDEDLKGESLSGIGSSKGLSGVKSREMGLLRSPVAMKRSVSTDRFMFTAHDKGKDSLLPK